MKPSPTTPGPKRRVVCFGEALVDFLNTGQEQVEGLVLQDFRRFPGGAPANAAVAVAKLGGDAWFAGQVGADEFGRFIESSLKQYGVNTRFLSINPIADTALAFVSLDDDGERSFTFRRSGTADLVFGADQIDDGWFGSGDIFHFCSNTLTTPEIAKVTESVVTQARQRGSLVSFDVNLRHNLWRSGKADRETVNRLLVGCDIAKLSRDELMFLSDRQASSFVRQLLHKGVALVLVTDGANTVRYYGADYSGRVEPRSGNVVDTTAAGDGFTGAMLFGLSQLGNARAILPDEEVVGKLARFATACGTHVVRTAGAFPSLPVFSDVARHWEFCK